VQTAITLPPAFVHAMQEKHISVRLQDTKRRRDRRHRIVSMVQRIDGVNQIKRILGYI